MTFCVDLGPQRRIKSNYLNHATALLKKGGSLVATEVKSLVAKDEFSVALATP